MRSLPLAVLGVFVAVLPAACRSARPDSTAPGSSSLARASASASPTETDVAAEVRALAERSRRVAACRATYRLLSRDGSRSILELAFARAVGVAVLLREAEGGRGSGDVFFDRRTIAVRATGAEGAGSGFDIDCESALHAPRRAFLEVAARELPELRLAPPAIHPSLDFHAHDDGPGRSGVEFRLRTSDREDEPFGWFEWLAAGEFSATVHGDTLTFSITPTLEVDLSRTNGFVERVRSTRDGDARDILVLEHVEPLESLPPETFRTAPIAASPRSMADRARLVEELVGAQAAELTREIVRAVERGALSLEDAGARARIERTALALHRGAIAAELAPWLEDLAQGIDRYAAWVEEVVEKDALADDVLDDVVAKRRAEVARSIDQAEENLSRSSMNGRRPRGETEEAVAALVRDARRPAFDELVRRPALARFDAGVERARSP